MVFTKAQEQAITARGNVLVMAGAGAGKTRTLVERCLGCLEEGTSLTEFLIVTFTEAAATELRHRIRTRLEERIADPRTKRLEHWREQLALFEQAHIGTLHGFCLSLIREHFYELAVDPQLAVLPEEEAHLLAEEALDEVLHRHYAGEALNAREVLKLIESQGGNDRTLRDLVLSIHHYTQTLPNPKGWFAEQERLFENGEPVVWRQWFSDALEEWRSTWPATLRDLARENDIAKGCLEAVQQLLAKNGLPQSAGPHSKTWGPEYAQVKEAVIRIEAACAACPRGKKGAWLDPLEDFVAETDFLKSLLPEKTDPLAEDWNWVRGSMQALLQIAQEFGGRYADSKKELGLADFHDLEQLALQLLWNRETNEPTACALAWREKLKFVFVDEYQDINAAQDKIIEALSRSGAEANRFLVGDVKQSIYRFRLAAPSIFRGYMRHWGTTASAGRVIPLVDNFRSRESILEFINSVFEVIMREGLGGIEYDQNARLVFGAPVERQALAKASNVEAKTELHLRVTSRAQSQGSEEAESSAALADLEDADKEARMVAMRVKRLFEEKFEVWDDDSFRAVKYSDVAILLRAPSRKAESYAKQFEKVGVPLRVERGGFYRTLEVLDMLSLLQILDNPLQDIPLIAVLHSPLAGLTMNELAEVRLACKGHFWLALQQWHQSEGGKKTKDPEGDGCFTLRGKATTFLERYATWRRLARQSSLSHCLDRIIDATHYDAWLLSQSRGQQRHANLQRFLGLARQFDQFQRQGLYRFLNFVEAQQLAKAEPSAAAATDENAVRLMSIHQSKGLEFPVVVVPDLGKAFNFMDLRADIILDEQFGLCSRVKPPHTRKTYPSLAFWLAARRQKRELLGEELRLLYVAMTRAQDKLILTGSVSAKRLERFGESVAGTVEEIAGARSYADWLALWCGARKVNLAGQGEGQNELLSWTTYQDDDHLAVGEAPPNGEVTMRKAPKLDTATARKLRARLSWEYPFKAATSRPAKASVTLLRRAAQELLEENEGAMLVPQRSFKTSRKTNSDDAQNRGTATHLFLQLVDLRKELNFEQLQAEAERITKAKLMRPEDVEMVDLETVEGFWRTPIGVEIQEHAESVRRELEFTARFAQAELDELIGRSGEASLKDEFVVVQGVADLVLMLPKEIWLIDFKTDAVSGREAKERARTYAAQMRLYARALQRIYGKPVTRAALYFLTARRLEQIELDESVLSPA